IAKWKACRISNQELQSLKWSYFPLLINSVLYLVKTYVETGNGAHAELYKANYTGQTITQLVKSTLTGTNFSGVAQNSQRFSLFNKMIGEPSEKPMVTNPEKDLRSITVTRLMSPYWKLEGDCYDFCVSGTRVRVLHRNTVNGVATNTSDEFFANCHMSYVIDLVNNTVTPDSPQRYPAVVNRFGSNIKDGPLAGAFNADWDNRVVRIGQHILCYNTYTRLGTPHVVVAENTSGISDFESLTSGRGSWISKSSTFAHGLYGSPLRMNLVGVMPIGDNTIIGRDATDTYLKIKYDPYGSYSPTLPGYGPSNTREVIDDQLYQKFKNMCWVFDGEKNKVAGGRLNEQHLSGPTTYENGVFGTPVSIDLTDYYRLIEELTRNIPNPPSGISTRKLQIDVFNERDVPVLATLTVRAPYPQTPSILLAYSYYFTIVPNATQGKISSWSNIRFITSIQSGMYVHDLLGLNVHHAGTPGAYKLRDGNWALSAISHIVAVTGNTQYALMRCTYNPTTKSFSNPKTLIYGLSDPGNYIGTKELGFGAVAPSSSGESCYMMSYGTTAAELNSGTETKYTLVMSRTDAGSNVTISQLGATKVKERIASLIPPTRKVNNMDLTRDRIVTTAMIGGDRVPNQRDNTYPLQQKHRDSVVRLSVSNHTHQPSAFTMAQATTDRKGGSVLGDLNSAPEVAFRVEDTTNLSQQLDALHSRESILVKTDSTVTVDYEV
ncbi:MAG: hypothetical protein ACRDAT_06400, partial [Cetobacterium sp.]